MEAIATFSGRHIIGKAQKEGRRLPLQCLTLWNKCSASYLSSVIVSVIYFCQLLLSMLNSVLRQTESQFSSVISSKRTDTQ